MRYSTLVHIALAALACGSVARAADDSPQTATSKEVMQGAPPSDIRSPVSLPSAISITSTQDSTNASLKGTYTAPPVISPKSQEKAIVSATLTSPVSKNSSVANLSTLDGFATATYLTVQYSEFLVSIDPSVDRALAVTTRQCSSHVSA